MSKSEGNGGQWVLFSLQGNEINETMSLKKGVLFADLVCMGKCFIDILHAYYAKVLEVNYNQCEDKLNQ